MSSENVIEKSVIKEDGGLYALGWYLSWNIDSDEAVLDGDFSADELIAIGQHMKKNMKKNDRETR